MSTSVVCRTVVVLAYLVALLVAGRPGWGAATAAPALVAVWLAPFLVAHVRHPHEQPASATAAAAALVQPGEATAG